MAKNNHGYNGEGFDLVRLTRSKEVVDWSPNAIRKFGKQGLKIYTQGRGKFFSKSELREFLTRPMPQPEK